jgi:hypothetical protein
MASLYITEFANLVEDEKGHIIPAGKTPPRAQQKVTFTTSSQSAAFNQQVEIIRVIADADVHLKFGSNPTATAADMLVKANTVEYFGVVSGQKVAAYDGSS